MTEILLASQSPRRQQLITLLGYPVHCQAADADEDSVQEPDPAQNVIDTAVLKANIVTSRVIPAVSKNILLIAADTTVALDGEMLNKPKDDIDARRMLLAMCNRSHQVHTGYVLQDLQSGHQVKGVHTAVVTMRNYSHAAIEAYIATGDPLDKAGAYAIQHPHFRPVSHLDGCFLSVMGLPLCDLILSLQAFQVPFQGTLTAVGQAHHHYPCPILPKIKNL